MSDDIYIYIVVVCIAADCSFAKMEIGMHESYMRKWWDMNYCFPKAEEWDIAFLVLDYTR